MDHGQMDWTLKEMRAIHHVIHLGTVTAAAVRMGISQPGVSRLLSTLEAKLATPLFERQGRGLIPTRAALDFVERSAAVFGAIEAMRVSAPIGRGDTLRVAAPPSFAQGFLQDAVAQFHCTNPGVLIQAEVRSTPGIFEAVSEGVLDLGITTSAVRHEALRDHIFRAFNVSCFMRHDHPLAQQKVVDPAAIEQMDMIGLSRRHATRAYTDKLLDKAGVSARIVVETSTAASAVSFVEKTGAVAFLSPFPVAAELPPSVTFRPLIGGPRRTARFVFSARIGQRPLTRRFMRAVTDISAKHDGWSNAV